MRLATGVIAALLTASLGACSSGSSGGSNASNRAPATGATTSSADPTKAQMAANYLRIIKLANDATDVFQKKTDTLGDNPSAADAQKVADPLVAAYRKT